MGCLGGNLALVLTFCYLCLLSSAESTFEGTGPLHPHLGISSVAIAVALAPSDVFDLIVMCLALLAYQCVLFEVKVLKPLTFMCKWVFIVNTSNGIKRFFSQDIIKVLFRICKSSMNPCNHTRTCSPQPS